MEGIPKVLILGHSFVRRPENDLSRGFDPRTHPTFCLSGVADVFMYGIGGHTAKTLQLHDLHCGQPYYASNRDSRSGDKWFNQHAS